MGDVIHALPAVATLKHSFPRSHLSWVIEPKWAPLIEGNPFVDEAIPLDRRSLSSVGAAWRTLRAARFDLAVDFQGLVKSALVAAASRASRVTGFHATQARERLAALFYSLGHRTRAAHVVDMYLELAGAAGAANVLRVFPLPPGKPEGALPEAPFVLACPLAGWTGKQWPLEHYERLASRVDRELGMPFVLNGPPAGEARLRSVRGAQVNTGGVEGLIHATRTARAVVGVDSGPLHLAAALSKPGAAIYGPTDPARNGPYGGSITVLRAPGAATTYKRGHTIAPSMAAVGPDEVFEALKERLASQASPAGCSA